MTKIYVVHSLRLSLSWIVGSDTHREAIKYVGDYVTDVTDTEANLQLLATELKIGKGEVMETEFIDEILLA